MADAQENEVPVELPPILDRPAPALEVTDDGQIKFGEETHGTDSN